VQFWDGTVKKQSSAICFRGNLFSREQAKGECDWAMMPANQVASFSVRANKLAWRENRLDHYLHVQKFLETGRVRISN
jgi:hypothetical protein